MTCRCHIQVFALGNVSWFGKFNTLNERTWADCTDLHITRKKANNIWFHIACDKGMKLNTGENTKAY